MENDRSIPGGNKSDNMYTYQEDQKNSIHETGAIRRSLGEGNPNAYPPYPLNNSSNNHEKEINRNSIIIEVDQSPPLYWMFFMIFGIIQIVFIIILANYYDWDEFNKPTANDSEKAQNEIKKKYKLFQEINIMIFVGFSFLRAFLKHYSWSSITLTLMGGILSFEFSLFF